MVDHLYTYTETVAKTVTIADLTQYKMLLVTIADDAAQVNFIGTAIAPCESAYNTAATIKAWGGSSSVWGSVQIMSTTSVVFNRTSSGTSCVKLYGIK